MPDFVTTIVAALIGSVLGSIGAVFANYWLTGRSERLRRRDILVQRYLFQLQDAIEMLWYRLSNLVYKGGRYVMTDDYFETTTLYALGRVLAIERILALEAVFPQLDSVYPKLGKYLMEHRLDRKLGSKFYQYDKVSLAEAIIVHEDDGLRASTFLEFRKLYEAKGSLEKQWLMPASNAIQHLQDNQMHALLDSLKEKAIEIAKRTGIDSSLTKSN